MCTVSGICTMYLLSLCSLRAFVSSMRRAVSYLPAACLSLSTSYDIFFIFFFSLLQSSGSYVHCIGGAMDVLASQLGASDGEHGAKGWGVGAAWVGVHMSGVRVRRALWEL